MHRFQEVTCLSKDLMREELKEFPRSFLEIFLYDLYVHFACKRHLWCLYKVLKRSCLYHFSQNSLKYQFWVKHRIISHISTNKGKIKVIVELPPPTNSKSVQCFMGHVGFYRRIIFNYGEIACPFYHLLILFV